MSHDPAEQDEQERDARREDHLREQRWDLFVQLVLGFQETEGWSGVLSAVGIAMREREREIARER